MEHYIQIYKKQFSLVYIADKDTHDIYIDMEKENNV
jgi:hypothetical protein